MNQNTVAVGFKNVSRRYPFACTFSIGYLMSPTFGKGYLRSLTSTSLLSLTTYFSGKTIRHPIQSTTAPLSKPSMPGRSKKLARLVKLKSINCKRMD